MSACQVLGATNRIASSVPLPRSTDFSLALDSTIRNLLVVATTICPQLAYIYRISVRELFHQIGGRLGSRGLAA